MSVGLTSDLCVPPAFEAVRERQAARPEAWNTQPLICVRLTPAPCWPSPSALRSSSTGAHPDHCPPEAPEGSVGAAPDPSALTSDLCRGAKVDWQTWQHQHQCGWETADAASNLSLFTFLLKSVTIENSS